MLVPITTFTVFVIVDAVRCLVDIVHYKKKAHYITQHTTQRFLSSGDILQNMEQKESNFPRLKLLIKKTQR